MTDKITYYHIYSGAMNPCTMAHNAREEAVATWYCSGCNHIKPGFQAIDAHIQESVIKGPPLNGIAGWGIPLARRDFLGMLGDDNVKKYLYVGKVFGPNDEIISEWVTFRGKEKLIVRGSKNVQYRRCDQCGRNVYFAMGKRYLYPDPPEGIALFESDLYGLIMPESLFHTINPVSLKGLIVDKLPVLSIPQDGLAELTEWYSIKS